MDAIGARDLVDRYFSALTRRDWTTVRTLLHDDLFFEGPLATLGTADEYLQGLEHFTARMTGAERRIVFAEGEDVLQIYEVSFDAPAVTAPVAEWLRIRDDRIAAIQMLLDPRPFSGAQPS
jgi:hypothetical protein